MSCTYRYKNKFYTEPQIKDLILEQDVLKNHPIITFTKKIFKTLPFQYKEDLLNEGSKKYGIERGESKATIKYSLADQYKVEYGLKAIEILQSNKAKQIFEKGKKNNWSLDKVLTELQIPKEQIQLILNLSKTDREEIITDLLANYSYTIEINTAKEQLNNEDRIDEVYQSKYPGKKVGDTITMSNNVDYLIVGEGLLEDNDDWDSNDKVIPSFKLELKNVKKQNTQYYSNLTVPGGTNYTENEITTPAITPSIKGHGEFATDKGIGWFRSDDKLAFTGFLEDLIASGIIKKVPCGS